MSNERSHPTPRGEALWRLHKDGNVASCELRGVAESAAGWELVVRIDSDITGTRHYDSERIARYYADALRQDYLRDGWGDA